jgi:hypothetical protein
MALIPGMFQVANGITLLGLLWAVSGAIILLRKEADDV